MSASPNSTITMNGRSTAYGVSTGSETFDLNGYGNTVLLGGAVDTVNILSGQYDAIDLNATGFTHATTDVINLGASDFDQVVTTQALYGATVSVSASGGPNTISLTNHGGQTSISLGNVGDSVLQGRAYGDLVKLNGDAANTVAITGGGNAFITIGTAGDGFGGYGASVTTQGVMNTVVGGDEAFTVSNDTAILNTVTLGNGNDHVAINGLKNTIVLGNGSDTLALSGGGNTATLGSGADTVVVGAGSSKLIFAAGDAGVRDSVTINAGYANIHGGDQNFSIMSAGHQTYLAAVLGDGNNTITSAYGNARLVIGDSTANTAHNSVTLGHGGANAIFNGGVDAISLNGSTAVSADTVVLNATLLGTSLTTSGVFDTVNLTQDANATINDTGTNAGLAITLNADSAMGFGNVTITGLANDNLAQIQLVGASAYSITTDATAAGGLTLHFAHGSIDLVGVQSLSQHLFGG